MEKTIKNKRRIMISKDVALGRFDLNVSELIVFLGIMGKMSQTKELSDEERQNWWSFSVEEYMEIREVSRDTAKEMLQRAGDNLGERWLYTADNEGRPIKYRWIIGIQPLGEKYNTIRIQWHPEILKFVSELKQYCTYDLKKLGNLKHFMTYRLYFWLSQKMYKCRNGRIEVNLGEFREQFGFEDSYLAYKELKKNILKPAIEEIQKKNLLNIGFREKKAGRWVVGLEFSWGLDRWEEERRED